jgi:hypothetical protein
MPYSQSLNDSVLLKITNSYAPEFIVNLAREIAGELGQKLAPWLDLRSAVMNLR